MIAGHAEYDHGTRDTFNAGDNLYIAATQLALDGDAQSGFSGSIAVALTGLTASAAACGDADGSGSVTVTEPRICQPPCSVRRP